MAKIIPLSKLFALLGSTILPPPMQQHQSEAHFRASFMILCLSLFTLLQFVTAMLCVMLCSIMFHLHTKNPPIVILAPWAPLQYTIMGCCLQKKLCGKLFCMMQNVMRDMTVSREAAKNGAKWRKKNLLDKKFITKDDLQWYAPNNYCRLKRGTRSHSTTTVQHNGTIRNPPKR